ncbi:unnamed protein product [Arctogadus glacialis]
MVQHLLFDSSLLSDDVSSRSLKPVSLCFVQRPLLPLEDDEAALSPYPLPQLFIAPTPQNISPFFNLPYQVSSL